MNTPSAAPPSHPPLGGLDFPSAIARADLIVVGIVERIADTDGAVTLVSAAADESSDRLRKADVHVLRTLQGNPSSEGITVLFLEGRLPSRPWAAPTEGPPLLLLLRSTTGGYVPVAAAEKPPAVLVDAPSFPIETTPSGRIARELEQLIAKADPVRDADELFRAASLRSELRNDLDLRLLEPRVVANETRRLAWLAIALAEEKIAALEALPPATHTTTAPAAAGLWSLIVEKLAALRAPEARPRLEALLLTERTDLAMAAAAAIRAMREPSAIPSWIRALDHPEQGVRYQAVIALAELEPAVGAGPSLPSFLKDEHSYLEHWRSWWKLRRPP